MKTSPETGRSPHSPKPPDVIIVGFATTFLNEKLAWIHVVAFVFLGVVAFFAFAFKAPGPAA